MTRLKYRIFCALIVPVLFLNLSASALFGAAHAVEELMDSSAHTISIFNVIGNDHCPACPNEDHPNNAHNHPSCEHHSSMYFGCKSLLIAYNPNITNHIVAEPFNAFPEVYPEKFIPPQIHV